MLVSYGLVLTFRAWGTKNRQFRPVDETMDAVFHRGHIPIEQESEPKTFELEISQDLGFVDGRNMIDSLILDQDAVFDNHINPVSAFNELAVIEDG